jgi:citrate synthase
LAKRSLIFVKRFDMIGLLEEIHETNMAIGDVNGEITAALLEVQQESGRAGRVYDRLLNVEQGINAQVAVLRRLRSTAADQAELSGALRDLTTVIRTEAESMADTAVRTAETMAQMERTAAQLAAELEAVERLNRELYGKLEEVEVLSARVLTRMP